MKELHLLGPNIKSEENKVVFCIYYKRDELRRLVKRGLLREALCASTVFETSKERKNTFQNVVSGKVFGNGITSYSTHIFTSTLYQRSSCTAVQDV